MNQEERAEEIANIKRTDREIWEFKETKDISSASCNQHTSVAIRVTPRMTPLDSRNSPWDFCPEEQTPRKAKTESKTSIWLLMQGP